MGNRIKFSRLFFSDLLSSVFGFVICLPSMNVFMSMFMKFASSLFVSFCAFRARSKLLILKNTFLLLSVATFYSAFVMWFSSMMKIKRLIYINNNEIYYDIPVSVLVFVMFVFLLSCSMFEKLIMRKRTFELIYDCLIEVDGRSVCVSAFMDTGNALKDTITGLPVIVIGRSVADNLLKNAESFLNFDPCGEMIKVISYKTVDGKVGIMPAFRPDNVLINGRCVDVIVAVRGEDFPENDGFDCLLNINCRV